MLHYGEVLYWPPWAELLSHLNHLMLGINSSSNIVIYVAKVSDNQLFTITFIFFLHVLAGFQVPACSLPELDLQDGGCRMQEDQDENIHHHDHLQHQPYLRAQEG